MKSTSNVHARWGCGGWREHFTLARPGVLPHSQKVAESAMDIEAMMNKLSETEQDICELTMQGYGFEEIRAKMGLTKKEFIAHIFHIHGVAKGMELEDYTAEDRKVLGF